MPLIAILFLASDNLTIILLANRTDPDPEKLSLQIADLVLTRGN